MFIAWSVYGVGVAGWADSYESDGVAPSSASQAASQALWLLGGGAVLTGGGLLALGWRIPGIVQLIVLGGGAVLVSSLASTCQPSHSHHSPPAPIPSAVDPRTVERAWPLASRWSAPLYERL